MQNITLISTTHKEYGKCNSDELLKIIEDIQPEVIFLEAFEDSYSKYHQMLFYQYGVSQERLEIKAIQKYSRNNAFEYVPILDIELADEFNKRLEIATKNKEYLKLIDAYNSLVIEGGFQFLNSQKNIDLHEEMREFENRIIDDEILLQKAKESVDAYENSMLRNIYRYSKEKTFETAIFMCGSAHRKSIIEKIKEYQIKEVINLNWIFNSDLN